MKTIGRDFGDVARKVYATASGTLPNGKPVVVNSDGTVSVVSGTDAGFGSKTNISGTDSNANIYKIAFDSGSNKIVFGYRDGNSYTAAVVGTVSGRSISFGTPAVMESVSSALINAIYDSNANKTVFFYRGSGGAGTAVVGTVSGTNISFGSKVTVASNVTWTTGAFDSNSNKVVLSYRDAGNSNYGTSRVGTISGTGISFGTAKVFLSDTTQNLDSTFDSNSNKIVVAYRDQGNSSVGTAIVGTVSGTNINFGSSAVFNNANSVYMRCAFDSNSNKVVIIYKDGGNSSNGTAVVATVSGTNISFGSEVVYEGGTNTGSFQWTSITFDSSSNKMIVSYGDNTDSNYGKIRIGTVSGTSISFSASTTYNAAESRNNANVYDSNANKTVIAFTDFGNSQNITGIVYGDASSNLTAENYIGMSSGGADPEIIGATSVFDTVANEFMSSVYDPDNNRVILSYADSGNSNYGTAVVGAISGNSITFGTPVVFKAAGCASGGITYDTTNNRVVITYKNASTGYGEAVVGTATSSSISFGTPVVFQTGNESSRTTPCFDSNAGKVAIFYGGPNSSIRARVATVDSSNNSISYGTEVVVDAGSAFAQKALYDSNSNKCVVFFKDSSNSGYGTSRVGTISGTDISFGTAVIFLSSNTTEIGAAFDTANNKCLVSVRDEGSSDLGKAFVGTVSGTNISFGSAFTFHASATRDTHAVYDTTKAQVIFSYYSSSSNNRGEFVTANVSGTSFTDLGSSSIFNGGASISGNGNSSVFDPSSANVVLSFRNNADSKGLAQVVTTENIGEVASGGAVLVNTKGAINTNQGSLTPGQSYFVQADGTISTTAGTPSVFAGTAVSATKLIVKG